MKQQYTLGLLILLGAGVAGHATEPFFQPLGGENPSVGFFRQAFDVSGDGSTVIGVSSPYYRPDLGFSVTDSLVWSAEDGLTRTGFDAQPMAVSYDGSVVVGYERYSEPLYPARLTAFRWDEATGVAQVLSEAPVGTATAVSANGGMVVGAFGPLGGGTAGFMWTPSGSWAGIGAGGGIVNDIRGVSADGNTMTGTIRFPDTHQEAAIWNQQGIFQDPQNVLTLGQNFGTIRDLSADGSTILGESGSEVFRWDESAGKQTIGYGYAGGISGDGSIVAASTGGANGAYIWDPINGQRFLSNILQNEFGFDVSEWDLHTVTGISDDGQTWVGFGTNPDGQWEAWIAQVPEPSSVVMMGLGLVCLLGVANRSRK